jgi:hypothetical protein
LPTVGKLAPGWSGLGLGQASIGGRAADDRPEPTRSELTRVAEQFQTRHDVERALDETRPGHPSSGSPRTDVRPGQPSDAGQEVTARPGHSTTGDQTRITRPGHPAPDDLRTDARPGRSERDGQTRTSPAGPVEDPQPR